MTKEEFWKKWMPCDWPPIEPSKKTKKDFMKDLDNVILDAAMEALKQAKKEVIKDLGRCK